MDLSPRPIADCTAGEVAAALTRGFEGYIVPLHFTPQTYERRFRTENLDPYASRIFLLEGAPAGVLLIVRRGWTSRVAAMGLAPEVRGQGAGQRVLQEAIVEAAARGDRTMWLEVFEQNPPALALYNKLGFQPVRRLVGYRRPADAVEIASTDALTEMDPRDFARLTARHGERDLPWVLQPESLAAATLPARAWHLEHRAYVLVADPGAERLSLTALVVPEPLRRQGWGSRMVHALVAMLPSRPWSVSPVLPEDLAADFFAKLGWGNWEINQIEMRLEIRPA